MKFIYTYILLLFLSSTTKCQNTGIVGQITNYQQEKMKAYLLQIKKADDFYNGSSFLVIDSASINLNGMFHFPDFNALPTDLVYRINFIMKDEIPGKIVRDYVNNNYIFLVNDEKPIEITSTLPALSKDYSIKSPSLINQYFQKILNSEDSLYLKIKDFITTQIEQQATADQAEENKTVFFKQLKLYVENELFRPIKKEIEEGTITDSRLLAFLIQHFEYDYNVVEDVIQINKMVAATDQTHQYIKEIKKKLEHSVFPDAMFPNFSLPSIDGKIVHLNDVEAELILIDFWASWCSPCRDENRNIVKPLYEQYKNKGFEVVGVNLDDQFKKWQHAVERDEINWLQVGDTLGKSSPVYQKYRVESLPTTYLLNHNKKVMHKNLRGDALALFIKNYFK